MIRIRKVEPSDVREYSGYLTESVKEEASYAASASDPWRDDYRYGDALLTCSG